MAKEAVKETTNEEVVEPKVESKKERYFMSRQFSALKIVLNANFEDPTLVEFVRFTPVKEKFQGDTVKVGYLKTSDPVVIARCEADIYVEEIDEKDFPKHLK